MRAVITTISAVMLALIGTAAASAQSVNLKGESVVLRALDKVTATTRDFTVPVGDSLTFGSLRVDVKHCEKRPPEDIPETFAFLQIFDTRLDGKGEVDEPAKVFSGWMMSSNPAISALDHRVYDIWVLGCNAKPRAEDMSLRP